MQLDDEVIMKNALVSFAVEQIGRNWQDDSTELKVQPPFLPVSHAVTHNARLSFGTLRGIWLVERTPGIANVWPESATMRSTTYE